MSGPRDPDAPLIREWGRNNGYDVAEKGRISAELRSEWATAQAGGYDDGGGNTDLASPEPDLQEPVEFSAPDSAGPYGPPEGPYGDGAGTPAERPPAQPPQPEGRARTLAGRLRDRGRDRDRERDRERSRPRRRRVTLETLGGLAWAGLARVAGTMAGGAFTPVARMMAYQSPVAGMVAEDALKGTVADAVLQPVARMVESGSVAGALIGPPVLTAVVCARPELYPVVKPVLEASLKEWIIVAGPKLREARRREEKFAEEMAAMSGEDEPALNIAELLDMVFAPPAAPDAGAGGPGAA